MEDSKHMQEAIALAMDNIDNGGGPFGAVVVKDGVVVGRGVNRVTADNDPTAHAEVSAIRDAARNLGTFDLEGCDIYTSCEPCPMCFGAIYWARLRRICYGCTQHHAAQAGFDDSFIYKQIALPPDSRAIPQRRCMGNVAEAVFKKWISKEDKTPY